MISFKHTLSKGDGQGHISVHDVEFSSTKFNTGLKGSIMNGLAITFPANKSEQFCNLQPLRLLLRPVWQSVFTFNDVQLSKILKSLICKLPQDLTA